MDDSNSPIEKVKEVVAEKLRKLSEEIDLLEQKLQNLPIFHHNEEQSNPKVEEQKKKNEQNQNQNQKQKQKQIIEIKEEIKEEVKNVAQKLEKKGKDYGILQDLVISENFNENDLQILHVDEGGFKEEAIKQSKKANEKLKESKKRESIGNEMKMGKNVVVAIDGSDESKLAFQHALEHSHPEDKIQVVHGQNVEVGVEIDSHIYESTVNKYLFSKLASQCQAQNRNCTFETKFYTGGTTSLSKGICDFAMNNEATNIIVGSRGHSGPKRFLLGSVSNSLIKNCPCSVTVIKKPEESIEE